MGSLSIRTYNYVGKLYFIAFEKPVYKAGH
jgi:hypothetical protein